MNLIEIFGLKIKPIITKGKEMWNPIETSKISNEFYAIRDKDVNLFLIATNNGYIAIDSGYKNSINSKDGLKKLNINPNDIKAVFLTHLDIDHSGGVDSNSRSLFPKATIYLSKEEEKYLTKQYYRKKILFHNCNLPISLNKGYKILDNNETIKIDNIEITAILVPGHTLGHTSFYIKNIGIFSGDSIIANTDGGYCFYEFWNADSNLNKQSLIYLKEFCKQNKINTIITSHSGVVKYQKAFKYINEAPKWKEKGFHFNKISNNSKTF